MITPANRSFSFTHIGILLGAAFPLISVTIDLIRLDLPLETGSITHIFQQFPLHWIILSAPVILGSVFYYFGNEFKKKEAVFTNERMRNKEELTTIEKFLSQIADSDFSDRDYSFYNPAFGQFLKSVRQTLRSQKEKDERRNWSAEGLATVNDILRNEPDLQKLLDKFLSSVVTYTGCNQGSLFLLSEDESTLDLQSCYAYERKKYLDKSIDISEGLIGSCYMEKNTIILSEVPREYIQITSGLGAAPPRFIVITPARTNAAVEGVLELAAFTELPDYKIRFIERACESLAAVISSRRINEKTKLLLEDSRLRAEELRSHEEEMRQNMEELQATQEEMERKSREMQSANDKLQSVIDGLATGLVTIGPGGLIESANKAAAGILGYRKEELPGLDIKNLFSQANSYGFPSSAGYQDILETKGDKVKIYATKKNGDRVFVEYSLENVTAGRERFYVINISTASPVTAVESGGTTAPRQEADYSIE